MNKGGKRRVGRPRKVGRPSKKTLQQRNSRKMSKKSQQKSSYKKGSRKSVKKMNRRRRVSRGGNKSNKPKNSNGGGVYRPFAPIAHGSMEGIHPPSHQSENTLFFQLSEPVDRFEVNK